MGDRRQKADVIEGQFRDAIEIDGARYAVNIAPLDNTMQNMMVPTSNIPQTAAIRGIPAITDLPNWEDG